MFHRVLLPKVLARLLSLGTSAEERRAASMAFFLPLIIELWRLRVSVAKALDAVAEAVPGVVRHERRRNNPRNGPESFLCSGKACKERARSLGELFMYVSSPTERCAFCIQAARREFMTTCFLEVRPHLPPNPSVATILQACEHGRDVFAVGRLRSATPDDWCTVLNAHHFAHCGDAGQPCSCVRAAAFLATETARRQQDVVAARAAEDVMRARRMNR